MLFHELLPRISALPLERVVLADRLPHGNVENEEFPVRSIHPETGGGTIQTETGGNDPSGPEVHAGRERCPKGRGGFEVTTFAVYSVDKVRQRKVQVGTVVERRRTDRGNNLSGLLKLAVSRFKASPGQKIQIEFGGFLVEL
jgi:hypothetical protein